MSELRENLAKFDQSHLLQFWDEISSDEQQKLVQNINLINLQEVVGYYKKASESLTDDVEKLDDRMEPIPADQCGSVSETNPDQLDTYRKEGLKRISENEVGVLLMAGGQGTRLGVSYPKGMYSVGLLSKKSLFQIQAERIRKLQELSELQTGKKGTITWYIMTSEHTMLPTKEFFTKNSNFGLDSKNIVYFEQGKLPCFDFDGKILLSKKYEVAQAPDGNGGLYRALRDKNIITDMESRGVKYLHAHSVDNILVQVADPVFIGYCLSKNADCGAKVVKKVVPTEAVGVVCRVDNLYQVVEYSEITDKTAELKDNKGDLLFNAGNICNHFFTTNFLKNIANQHENSLKLHVAKKKIPYVNKNGETVKPTAPNGIKIEKFIFDVFQFTDKFVTWEVPRDVEFSALKNADDAGKDCPSTARSDLYALHKRYLLAAGGTIDGNEVEISPLLSYAGEGLTDIVKGQTYKAPLLLHSKDEAVN